MASVVAFDSSTMCGLYDKVVQERASIPTQLPIETLISRIGVGIIMGLVGVAGLRRYLTATLPDFE